MCLALGMLKFANHILAVAYENNLSVSNLQLQKVMYFAMRDRKDEYKLLAKIYDESFYVWRYGPTVPSIHRKYKGYGSRAIIDSGEKDDTLNIFNSSILLFLEKKPFSLVEESHRHSFWKVNEDKIHQGTSDVKYSLEDILNG